MENKTQLEVEIRTQNEKYIQEFQKFLQEEKGYVHKTIKKHCQNVSFFLNGYLLRLQGCGVQNAYTYLDDFFGYYLIYKCVWSTPNAMKEMAVSIRKFYAFLKDQSYITKEICEDVSNRICFSIEDWMEECDDYNNGKIRFY